MKCAEHHLLVVLRLSHMHRRTDDIINCLVLFTLVLIFIAMIAAV